MRTTSPTGSQVVSATPDRLANPTGAVRTSWADRAIGWYQNYDILFVAYVASLAVVYFTNDGRGGQFLFLPVVIPLALLCSLPWQVARGGDGALKRSSVPERTWRLMGAGRSVLLWAAFVYLMAISVPDLFTYAGVHEANGAWVNWRLGIETIVFLAITALLVAHYRDFVSRLVLVLGVLIALSTLINMIAFAAQGGWPAFADRFVPVFGLAGNRVATTAGLTYSLTLLAAVTVAVEPDRVHWQRAILLLSAAVLFAALLWTKTRGAYVATLAGFLVLAALRPSRRRLLAIGATVITALVVLMLIDLGSANSILARGDSYRLEIWPVYLPMAAEHPWLGYGQIANTMITIGGSIYNHPHNLVLTAQILGGAPAAVAMLVMLAGGIYWATRFYRAGGGAAVLIMMVGLVVAGMTDFKFVTSYPNWFWATLWLPIGLCIGAEIALRKASAMRAQAKS